MLRATYATEPLRVTPPDDGLNIVREQPARAHGSVSSKGKNAVKYKRTARIHRSAIRVALSIGAAACLFTSAPQSAAAQARAPDPAFALHVETLRRSGDDFYSFYANRSYRPLWLSEQGRPRQAVADLLKLLDTAEYDGLAAGEFEVDQLKTAIEGANVEPSAPAFSALEIQISKTFVAYASALRSSRGGTMLYEHDSLRPQSARPFHILQQAANASSLEDYVSTMGWMHPLYAQLRRLLDHQPALDSATRKIALDNLTRIRGIASPPRHIVVDIASARLWMYEDGRQVDSMRVVVGRVTNPTPMLAGYIRHAIINPYWNVPPELVSKNIAANVLRAGPSYLMRGGYQVLSDWGDDPKLVNPREVNWSAAARGELDLRIRQLPRPGNAMGKVKFEFPNDHGIYLHDTPDKALMHEDARQLSAGCVRLEDAERLGRWLMGGAAAQQSNAPETRIELPRPVPIYLTYLTLHADAGQLAIGPDPYSVDRVTRPGGERAAPDQASSAVGRGGVSPPASVRM